MGDKGIVCQSIVVPRDGSSEEALFRVNKEKGGTLCLRS